MRTSSSMVQVALQRRLRCGHTSFEQHVVMPALQQVLVQQPHVLQILHAAKKGTVCARKSLQVARLQRAQQMETQRMEPQTLICQRMMQCNSHRILRCKSWTCLSRHRHCKHICSSLIWSSKSCMLWGDAFATCLLLRKWHHCDWLHTSTAVAQMAGVTARRCMRPRAACMWSISQSLPCCKGGLLAHAIDLESVDTDTESLT
jgi:hypothetical protein